MMSETANNDSSTEVEKPVRNDEEVKFPPFPEPTDDDFEEGVTEEEKVFYKNKFPDLNLVKNVRLHCTACDRHLGCSARNESRMRSHPMLRTLVCNTCHSFYNSGEFDKGEDGSELYCRWCGQGGQVYCCSDCPHVFCAKCIKRNLGMSKIKEIEDTDDWKCFKCNSKCLWDLRSVCWALLRYCDVKNKIAYKTQDPILKEKYQKDCGIDHTECCKNKGKRKEKTDSKKKEKEKEKESDKKAPMTAISKLPPSIQVKKFASINLTESPKPEKKAPKRVAEKLFMKTPVPIAPNVKIFTSVAPPPPKKFKMQTAPVINPIRLQKDKNIATYSRIQPRFPQTHNMPATYAMLNNQYNGFNNVPNTNMMYNSVTDNLNLSLENLTQGLDIAAAFRNNAQDDVVCTPDFPIEPICEVTEDHTDDDVQCITPGPVHRTPPPPVSRVSNTLPDISSDNIIQMTDNDVTVNPTTGGLKFRVDPQTLSSNKMYRLPDGRVFAINSNPNMPGGYSATIVAFAENSSAKAVPKGPTFAAKLSAVIPQSSTPTPKTRNVNETRNAPKRKTQKKVQGEERAPPRQCDLKVPVEFYRYNLIDAVDALEYSLSRLQKLKKEATTMFLRSRTLSEMRTLHRNLDRLLNTSCTRFTEIKSNLNTEMKQYVLQKMDRNATNNISEEDDDDVEILNDSANEEPIFIDENSMDSNVNVNDTHNVDLTAASSEHNESEEKLMDQNDSYEKDRPNNNESDPLSMAENKTSDDTDADKSEKQIQNENDKSVENNEQAQNNNDESVENSKHSISNTNEDNFEDSEDLLNDQTELNSNNTVEKEAQSTGLKESEAIESEVNGKSVVMDTNNREKDLEDKPQENDGQAIDLEKGKENPDICKDNENEEKNNSQISDVKAQDLEEMIEDLLNDSSNAGDSQNNMMDISEFQDTEDI